MDDRLPLGGDPHPLVRQARAAISALVEEAVRQAGGPSALVGWLASIGIRGRDGGPYDADNPRLWIQQRTMPPAVVPLVLALRWDLSVDRALRGEDLERRLEVLERSLAEVQRVLGLLARTQVSAPLPSEVLAELERLTAPEQYDERAGA